MEIIADLPVKGGDSKRYRAVCKLGGGTFGDILAAVNEIDAQDWIALKIEARYLAGDKDRKYTENSMVRFERLVCQELTNCAEETGGCPCPVVHRCFCEAGEHDILAMELLGPHLRDYATAIREWPLPQDLVLTLGACLIGRLQQLHAAGFVHRDLKPENVLLRLEEAPGQNGVVPCFLLVDYALAMRIAQLGGSDHIEERGEAQTAGTFRYMAVHAQKGATQSRRSDLESLAYVLIYLAKGQLPWQFDDPKGMVEKKESISAQELCAGLHPAFANFLQTTQNFSFAERPNYEFLMQGLLDGVSGPLDFHAGKVRHDFKQKLRREHLRCRAARAALVLPAQIRQPAPAPWVRIFVRSKITRFECSELSLHRPSCLEHFENPRSFFFEAFRDPLPGTVHVIGGALHFFAFLKKEYLLQALGEELAPRSGIPLSDPAAGVEEVLVFSSGKRDFVTRSLSIPEFDIDGHKPYKERWNLRAAFWSRVCAPKPIACQDSEEEF